MDDNGSNADYRTCMLRCIYTVCMQTVRPAHIDTDPGPAVAVYVLVSVCMHMCRQGR